MRWTPGLKGIGDINSAAQAALTAAGYTNVNCKPVTVTYPGGSYVQNQCSTGQGTTITADNVSGMSQQQLQTQLNEETQAANGNILQNILALTGNSAATAYAGQPAGTVQPAALAQPVPPIPGGGSSSSNSGATGGNNNVSATPGWVQQLESLLSTTAGQATAPSTPQPASGPSVPTVTPTTVSSTIIAGIPDMYVYIGGAAIALLFFMRGK